MDCTVVKNRSDEVQSNVEVAFYFTQLCQILKQTSALTTACIFYLIYLVMHILRRSRFRDLNADNKSYFDLAALFV